MGMSETQGKFVHFQMIMHYICNHHSKYIIYASKKRGPVPPVVEACPCTTLLELACL